MSAKTILMTAALSALLAGTLAAQQMQQMPGHDHASMNMSMSSGPANEAPATKGYMAANEKMHTDMAVEYSGDADVDFVRSMIPHHQGAIDMARVELEHGKDPEIRKLAEGVIKAQEAEIAEMQAWLKARGK
ncbi:DUF305 domain-containing protein [Rhizobium puerariae]|uniref:DUF305 domain-containing protein n=1 Tax=Rhizobium puerariae TaxID=1585791 RepID=A0ABV6AIL7_9HYPH